MNIFGELERDLGYLVHRDQYARRGTRELAPIIDALIAPSQAPAAQPVNLKTGHPEGEPVSIASDAEQGYQAVKDELAKFESALPSVLEQARKFEASPFAAIAEKAASAVLPPEAVAVAVKAADVAIDGLIALYNPQQDAQPASAPAQ